MLMQIASAINNGLFFASVTACHYGRARAKLFWRLRGGFWRCLHGLLGRLYFNHDISRCLFTFLQKIQIFFCR